MFMTMLGLEQLKPLSTTCFKSNISRKWVQCTSSALTISSGVSLNRNPWLPVPFLHNITTPTWKPRLPNEVCSWHSLVTLRMFLTTIDHKNMPTRHPWPLLKLFIQHFSTHSDTTLHPLLSHLPYLSPHCIITWGHKHEEAMSSTYTYTPGS